MALSISKINISGLQNRRIAMFRLAFDSSYPVGGESLTPGNVRMREVELALIEAKDGYMFDYDRDNDKIKVIYPRGYVAETLLGVVDEGAVAVTSTAPNGNIISFEGEAGVAGGSGSEVPNGTDLQLLTDVRVMFIGY